MSLPHLILKKHEERRLKAGHHWVFSNEVDVVKTPLQGFEPGQAIEIHSASGQCLGSGFINPQSLICARLVSRQPNRPLNQSLLRRHLEQALRLRQRVFGAPYYRLVYGESDALPGLVIDRFGDVLVIQITTAGMERCIDDLVTVLTSLLAPVAIVLKNDAALRALEGLDSSVSIIHGSLPDTLLIEENGCRFAIDPINGQKTGWFFDHRDNRNRMQQMIQAWKQATGAPPRVLDIFSYIGAWGIAAAVSGASEVVCIDSSAQAMAALQHNARLNGVGDTLHCLQGDAFDTLKALHEQRERFDIIIADPPAFIKRKKDKKNGLQGYRRLNQLALSLVNKEGLLVSASCSYHLSRDELLDLLMKTARHVDRDLQLIAEGHQASDHPVHPAIPETAYLKAMFCRVMATR